MSLQKTINEFWEAPLYMKLLMLLLVATSFSVVCMVITIKNIERERNATLKEGVYCLKKDPSKKMVVPKSETGIVSGVEMPGYPGISFYVATRDAKKFTLCDKE